MRELTIGDIPKKYRRIAKEIGVESYIKLCQTMGGRTLYIPREDALLKEQRNMEIADAYEDGVSISELADIYGISDAHIYRIVNSYQI